jgi:hypothetical protein
MAREGWDLFAGFLFISLLIENACITQGKLAFDLTPHFLSELSIASDDAGFSLSSIIDHQVVFATQPADLYSHP